MAQPPTWYQLVHVQSGSHGQLLVSTLFKFYLCLMAKPHLHAKLLSPNEVETAVKGCHSSGNFSCVHVIRQRLCYVLTMSSE